MSSKSKKRKAVQKKPQKQGSVKTNEASLESYKTTLSVQTNFAIMISQTPIAINLTSSSEIDMLLSSNEIYVPSVSKDIPNKLPGQSLKNKEEQPSTFTELEYNVKWPDQSQNKKRNLSNDYNSYKELSDSSVKEYNKLHQKKSSVYSPLSEENNYHDNAITYKNQLQQLGIQRTNETRLLTIKAKYRSKKNDIVAAIRHTLFSVFNEEHLDHINSNISPIKLAEWKSNIKTKTAYEELFKDQQILLKIEYIVFKQYKNKELPLLHYAFILSICDILLNPKSLNIKYNDKSVMRCADAFL
ncbi:hypothetical protein F8M41_023534 [Gigaspora margarita]|uniref:Uncharacterized protein n=1 Tax=Gigaspora margarita TaxID=4874 RepID=A0A8H4AD67_GIGMA|nr:hypothetical protein F8M41_023534 [Gigaspora margarita]